MKTTIIASLLLVTTTTFAGTLKFTGMGVDDQVCTVEISYTDDNVLTDVKLTGATKDFALIAETSNGYGPEHTISPRGAGEILSMFQEDKSLYSKMSYRVSYLKNSEIFRLTIADMKKNAPPSKEGEDLKWLGGKMELELFYDRKSGDLIKVEAENNFKALVVLPIASKKFVCSLNP